jgi:tetraacyldisaccharide 4'-kinase
VNEVDYLSIISGARHDWRARCLKTCFGFLSLFYGTAVAVRNRLFDWGLKRARPVSVPVISLGNLTTGGTGKTPLVAWLSQWFQAQGISVALLSRGYRALPGEVNDEKLLLDRLCPQVPHYQNPDRCASAEKAVEAGASLLILDDGFQHRRLARDLDIVLIDAVNPWGYGHQLPRGLLRESKSGLRRAGFVLITRVDQCPPELLEKLTAEVKQFVPEHRIAHVRFAPQGLVNAAGETRSLHEVTGKQVWGFCAIGNPRGFQQTLVDAGGRVCGMRVFADHYHYSERDLQEIGSEAAQSGAELILTTAKDLVKISEQKLSGLPVWAVEIGAEIVQGAADFEEILRKTGLAESGE